jgi:hypothetical protein
MLPRFSPAKVLHERCFSIVQVFRFAPAKEEEAQKETDKVLKGNRFAILAAESEQVFSLRV